MTIGTGVSLGKMIAIQKDFQTLLQKYRYSSTLEDMNFTQRNAAFKDTVLGLVAETVEFLDRVNWKMHVLDQEYNRHEQVMEVVDIFKYAVNLLVYLNVDEMEFEKVFYEKSRTVLERFGLEFPVAKKAVYESVCRINAEFLS